MKKRTGLRRPSAAEAGGERGFTLIETSIAILIMMVAGFGAISLFLFSINFGAGAADRARAFAVAQQRMELMRNTPFNNLTATLATANTGTVTVGSAANGDQRTFNITTTIVDDTAARLTASRRKIITITVTPPAAGRWSSGPVVLKTYRASGAQGNN
jgi:prepilin-type N-terminal cleavage/methylation domain-containing protein